MYICSLNLVKHLFFRTILGKANWSELPRGLKKSRVSIQCLTADGKLSLVRIIGNQGFKKGEGVSVQRLPVISQSDLY